MPVRFRRAEIAETMIPHVAAVDEHLGAYLTLTPDLMREHARRVDARIAAGESLPLAGVPAAIKDNMCLLGTRTTCASKILEQWVAPYTATAVERLARRRRAADRQDEHGRVRHGQLG